MLWRHVDPPRKSRGEGVLNATSVKLKRYYRRSFESLFSIIIVYRQILVDLTWLDLTWVDMSNNMPSIGGSTVEHFPTPKISRNLTRFSLPAIKFHILLVSPFNHTVFIWCKLSSREAQFFLFMILYNLTIGPLPEQCSLRRFQSPGCCVYPIISRVWLYPLEEKSRTVPSSAVYWLNI